MNMSKDEFDRKWNGGEARQKKREATIIRKLRMEGFGYVVTVPVPKYDMSSFQAMQRLVEGRIVRNNEITAWLQEHVAENAVTSRGAHYGSKNENDAFMFKLRFG
ncbi:hypothetical protein [Microvirga sp. BSC39]|uniref:hypothetical protein n=1 Tax=Microvirga sp. BSC39 TaxID=1549810 RepID=UPI0004E8F3F0|nr:hypothetical protein [Microvirga sp. BSC39]KFG67188.1 hypothetical protein JH26_24200 [Microvirga sp. BSC39]